MKRLGVLVVALCACGSDAKTKLDAATIDAPHDARPIDSSAMHLDGPPGTQQLTVKNYLNWCSVTVNGGTASAAPQQQVFVAPGTYTLTATKASAAFTIGPKMWHHTDGDTANMGEDGTQASGTSTAMVTVGTAATCVWVCCPFTNGTGCDGIADQCP